MDIKRESIVVKDVSLSVLTAGDVNGPAVVLLHGFPEEAKAWMEEIQFLSSKGYFVIAPDQRGYGKSDKPQSISDYRLEILGEDIISLMDYFKKERAYLIGHDWGCVVGWHLLDLYKERFIQSILMSSPHASIFQKHLLTNPIQVLKSWYMFTIQLPKIPEMYIARNDYKNFAEQIK